MASEFADELNRHPRARLVAAASSHPDRAVWFAEQKGCPLAFDTYEALIRCDEVDVVYIATTHESHFDNAMMCIENRKPSLVEKPICTAVSDLATLIRAAKTHRVFCMEAMWMLCFPAVAALKTALAPISPLIRLNASFCIHVPFDPNHRLYNPVLGGGALLDIGIYPLTLARHLFGLRTERMECQLSFAPTGTDDAGEITLVYPDNRIACLSYSLKTESPHTAEIIGEQGRAVIENFFHPSKISVSAPGIGERIATYTYPIKGYNYEIDAVHAALEIGATKSDVVPFQTSLEILSAMEKILLVYKNN